MRKTQSTFFGQKMRTGKWLTSLAQHVEASELEMIGGAQDRRLSRGDD